jgi:hypothetical protein
LAISAAGQMYFVPTSERNAAWTSPRVMTRVVGSGEVMSVILSQPLVLKAPKSGLTIICQESMTSWAENGSPLWNVTPCRMVKVQVRPSSDIWGTASARPGISVCVES